MCLRVLAGLALLALSLASTAQAQSSRGWTLGLSSFGPFRYGMTLAQAEAASGNRIRLQNPTESLHAGACRDVDVDGGNATLLFTWDGRWVLRTAFVPSLQDYYDSQPIGRRGHAVTRSDIGLGASEADVRRTYPNRIRRETVSVNEGSEDWLVYTSPDPPDRGLAVVFKLLSGRVGAIVGGQADWLSAYDACQ